MTRIPADYHIIVPVWGQPYSGLCIDFLIPSLIADGNLSAISTDQTVLISFCCPPETRALIEECAGFDLLSGGCEIDFPDNSEILAKNDAKHGSMTESIFLALRDPRNQPGHTVFVFLNPDVIVSRETFSRVRATMRRGRKALMVTGLRVRLDQIHAPTETFRDGPSLNISGPDLSTMALDNLHPFCSAYIWNRDTYPVSMPVLLFYENSNRALMQHCFHLHPLAVVCPETLPVTRDTIDGDFLEKCGLIGDDFEIVTDDDNAVVVEISGGPYLHPDKLRPGRRRRLADFAVGVSDVHYSFFWHRIDFNGGVKPACGCPELDRLLRYVRIHHPRRKLRQRYPHLDRRLFRRVFRAIAWIATLHWPSLGRAK